MNLGRTGDESCSGYGGYTKERWQTLYELGLKKKEDREILRKTYQEMKELEDTECTFQP